MARRPADPRFARQGRPRWQGRSRGGIIVTALVRGAFLLCALLFGSGEAATVDWSKWSDLPTVEVITTDAGGGLRTTTVWIVVVEGQAYLRTGNTIWGGNVEREGKLKLKGGPGEHQCRAERITDLSVQNKVTAAFRAKYGFRDVISSVIRLGKSRIFRLSE
jgi:hypothetical protein